MPTLTHSQNNELNTVLLQIELPKSEYLPTVEKKLKDYRKKVQIKGFREGQVPVSYLKAKFGESILWEEVKAIVDKSISDFIQEHNLKIIGAPMPLQEIKTSIQRPTDISVGIELGFVPAFEIEGISLDTKLPFHEVVIDDKTLEEEIDYLRTKRATGFEEGVTDIQKGDLITISLVEVQDGAVVEGGLSNEETYLQLDKCSETLRNKLMSATVGDKMPINIADLDVTSDEESLMGNYFQHHHHHGCEHSFEMTIVEVKRPLKRELNAEFYKEIFPNDDIVDFEVFREKARVDIQAQFEQPSQNLFNREVYQMLMAKNNMPLPESFLRRWVETTEYNGPDDKFDEEFEKLLTKVRWSLILDKLTEERNISVTEQDIEMAMRMAIARYYQYQISPYHAIISQQVEKMMKDEDSVRHYAEKIQEDKVFAAIKNDIGKEIKKVSVDEFNALHKKTAAEDEDETFSEEEVDSTESAK